MAARFPNVPEIDFAVKDSALIQNAIITAYQAAYQASTGQAKTLAPGDPVRLFLLTVASLITQQRTLIDAAGKQNLLNYATGPYLDNLATIYGSLGARLAASAAVTTIQFTLSAALGYNVVIPAGTQVAAPNLAIFATNADLTITAGSTTGSTLATCTQTGSAYNGLVAGQVNQLVNWTQSFVVSATNTTTTAGGGDAEADDAFAQRIYLIPEAFSVAGPTGAYEYWALTANPTISDVAVWSPSAGNVSVAVLLDGGQIPTTSVLNQVAAVLNTSTIRPLTDNVTVVAPTVVNYTVSLTYYISPDNSSANVQSSIQAAVSNAVNDYTAYVQAKIGRNIDPSKLIQMVIDAGASRVSVTSPTLQVLTVPQLGVVTGTPTVTFGGIDNSD